MNTDIKNKIALVTGANRGIGKAIVESFIQHGAKKVYLAVRNPESTLALTQEYGDKVSVLKVDVADQESIKALAASAQDVEVVVNNAGVLELADPLSDNIEEALTKELLVNTFGLIRMAKAFSPIIEQNGGGAFVQLNSAASIKNFLGFTSYSASKAAAYSITQGLKDQLAPKNIQVVSVHPGPIDTAMAEKAEMGEIAASPSVVANEIVASLKAGDFHLFPDEMAKQIGQAYQFFSDNVIEAEAS